MRNDYSSNYLAHHGILGQKWGIRRYQNPDGSLTEAGKKRYGSSSIEDISSAKGMTRRLNDIDKARARNTRKLGKTMAKISQDNSGRKNTRLAKKTSEIQTNITKGQQETEKLLKRAEDQGYDVSSGYTRRLVASGAEIIGRTLLTSAIASAVLMPTVGKFAVVPSWVTASGKKYKVKDPNSIDELKKDLKETKKDYKKYESYSNKDKWNESESEEKYNKLKEKESRVKALEKKRNSFTSDEDKDLWERGVTAGNSKARKEAVTDRVKYAKETGMFDMEFLERNLDLDPVTEKQMKGQKLYDAYEKFLEDEYKKNH